MRHIVRLQPYHLGTFDLFAARNTFDELYIRQHWLDGFQPGRMPAEHDMLLLGVIRERGARFLAGPLLPRIVGQSENQFAQVVEFLLLYASLLRLFLQEGVFIRQSLLSLVQFLFPLLILFPKPFEFFLIFLAFFSKRLGIILEIYPRFEVREYR